jgi:hypothetical protein
VYLQQALGLPLTQIGRPGPGLFPVVVGTLCLTAAAGIAWEARRELAPVPEESRGGARAGLLALALAGFCLALPWLGYLVTTLLLLTAVVRLAGESRWPVAVATAVAFTAGSAYLFGRVLGVPLPTAWSP